MLDGMKTFFLHKITLRVIYIIAAYSVSHLIALLTQPGVQIFLRDAGITLMIDDPVKLRSTITAGFLIGGEFVYRYLHTKFILPHVQDTVPQAYQQMQQTQKPIQTQGEPSK